MAVPPSFTFEDPSKDDNRPLRFIKAPSYFKEKDQIEKNSEAKQEKSPAWNDKLTKWKQMLASKGAIKGYDEKRIEIFESGSMSILACL